MDDVNGQDFLLMIRLSNFFNAPHHGKLEFISLYDIGKRFEKSMNPSKTVLNVLSKMRDMGFLQLNEDGMLEYDDDKFDSFVEEHALGKDLFEYVDNHFSITWK